MNSPSTDFELRTARELIDSRRLLYFYHVAKTGRFTAAEATLNIAQSALSRQLRQLEEDLGVQLFNRTGHGVRLTHYGQILLKHAELILQNMASTIEDLDDARHQPQVNVGIAAPPSFMATYMPDIILGFMDAKPDARIRAVEASTGGVYTLLANEEVDLAIVLEPVNKSRLTLRKLSKENMYVMAAPNHPIADQEYVPRRQLKELSLVWPASLYGSRAILSKYLEGADMQLRSQVEVDSLPLMRQLVMKRPLCTILPRSACRAELEDGSLISRPLRPSLSRTLYIASLKDRPISDSMQAVIEQIVSTIKNDTSAI